MTTFNFKRAPAPPGPTRPTSPARVGRPRKGGQQLKVGNLLREQPHWDLLDDVMFLDKPSGRDKLCTEVGIEIEPSSRLFQTNQKLAELHQMVKGVLQQGVAREERGRLYIEVQTAPPEDLHPYRDVPESEHELVNLMAQDRYEYLEQLRQKNLVKRWRFFMTCTSRATAKFSKEARPTPEELVATVRKADAAAASLLGYLRGAGYEARRMSSNEMFKLAYRYLNPGRASGRLPNWVPPEKRVKVVPTQPKGKAARPRERLFTLKEQLFQTPVNNEDMSHLRIGPTGQQKHVGTVSLARVPQRTVTGMLARVLEKLDASTYYVVLEFDHNDPMETDKKLEVSKNRLFSQMGSGTKEAPNVKAQAKLRDLNQTIKHLTSTGDHTYRVGMTLVLIADSAEELRQAKESAVSACAIVPGSGLVKHDFQSLFQWFSLIPFNGQRGQFMFEATETTASDFFPPVAPWKGGDRPTWVVRTRQNSLANVDFFTGPTNANHFAVFAPTGYGKTFTVMSLLSAHIRAHNPFVTVVDRKEDFKFFIRSLSDDQKKNSAVVPFYPGAATQLNPMDLPEGDTKPDAVKQAFLLALVRYFVPPSSNSREAGEEKALILEALSQTYRRVKREGRSPLLSEFAATLNAMEMYSDGGPIAGEQQALARSIALRLRPVLGEDSPWGPILDRPTNVNTHAQFMYYDLSGIADSDMEMRRVALHIVNDRIWQAAKRLPRSVRKIAFIDEFGSQIQTEEDKAFVSTTLRLARSSNLAFGLATQTLEDMNRISGMEEAIYWYLLGRLEGGEQVIRDVLKLPDSVSREISLLKEGRGFKEWALIYRSKDGPKNGDIIKVEESRRSYWYLTSEPGEAARRDEYLKRYGNLKDAVQAILNEEAA
ncbi:TraC family protein [Deinococcus xianganensis]|uniref:TraC family protein n=1 Tax=Deinococcus xianganensis TaxID=1507289 RepID=A0A6I4YCB7_9DEIO|nr:TraC family protein [Deinococcus xianganensis]